MNGIKAGQRQRVFAAAEKAIDADKTADARFTHPNVFISTQQTYVCRSAINRVRFSNKKGSTWSLISSLITKVCCCDFIHF